MATYGIMPLGHDYDSKEKPTRIGPGTVTRCEWALKKLRALQAEGHEVFMVLPAPSLRTKDGIAPKTMGLMMYEWFINVAHATDVEYLVNQLDREYPHTTFGELLWGLPTAITHRRQLHLRNRSSKINDLSDTVIIIVSNERHLKRVWWVIELMLPEYRRRECKSGFVADTDYSAHYKKPCIRYEPSDDPPSSVGHEFLSYGKLALMWVGIVRP